MSNLILVPRCLPSTPAVAGQAPAVAGQAPAVAGQAPAVAGQAPAVAGQALRRWDWKYVRKRGLRVGLVWGLTVMLMMSWGTEGVARLMGEWGAGRLWGGQAQAASSIMTTRADFEAGLFDGTEADSQGGELNLMADGAWGPKVWATPGQGLTAGTAIASDGTYVYVLTSRDNYFIRYTPSENKWDEMAVPLHQGDYGADMIVLGDYIYVIWGGYQKEFSRYSILADSWIDLDSAPDLFYAGSSIETDGTDLYLLRGYYSTEFWKYDVSEAVWSTLSSTPATMYHGADLTYYDGYLYTPRGYNQKTFYRYKISTDTWDTRASSLVSFYDVHNMDEAGGYIYGMRDRATNTFYRYDISGNSWETLTTTPDVTRYVGVVYNSGDDQLYVFRGNGQREMWKYDRGSDEFLGPAYLLASPGTGADLVYNDGYLYHPRGGNTTSFYRYDVGASGDTWEARTAAPVTFNDDVKGVGASGNLYFFQGSNTTAFYSYNPGTNAWSSPLAVAPATVRYGAGLAYPGTGDFIYATRGNYTRNFWRYSISGNSWDDGVAADLPDDAEAAYGARLIADGDDTNVLYYISGSRTAQILKYEIDIDTWTDIGNLPYAPFYGTDVVYRNYKLYIQAGFYKPDFYEFELAAGGSQYTWRRMPDLSTYYAQEVGPYNGGSLETDGTYFYSIHGMNLLRMQMFTPGSYSYATSGTWTSEVEDLVYVGTGTTMTVAVGSTTPGDSSVSVETRTSTDMISWSGWEGVVGGVIQSPSRQYVQLRVTLTASSDRSQAPKVTDMTIGYVGDENVPNNPSSFESSSQQIGGDSLTSGETYNHINPYFSWSGASDDETSVAGYYVYFGSAAAGDPETVGVYQSGTGYLSTTALTVGNYYLRVKTKDALGNVSATVDGFTYVFSGIEALGVGFSGSSQFSGVGTSVTTTGDEIKLVGKNGFWEEDRLSRAPGNIYYGSGMAYVESSQKLYVNRGVNTNAFWNYDIATDVWAVGSTTPANMTYGGDVVEGPSGYLYAFRGGNTGDFWRYEIAVDTWSEVADAPQQTYMGSSLIYDGGDYIYALKGNNDDAFWRYDTGADGWELMTSADFGAPSGQPNNYVRYGGDLTYDGSDTVYAIQGNLRSGFASYSISSDQWTVLPTLPALAYGGAQIEYDVTSNAIYFIAGYQKPLFFKYDLNSGEWSSLDDAPSTIYYGSSMRNVDGNLYITRGYNSPYFYKYEIAKGKWSTPQRGLFGQYFRGSDYNNFHYGADIVKGAGNYYYLTKGYYDDLFVRWDSSTGETLKLKDIPGSFYVGGALGYDSVNDKVYAVTSQYSRKLLEYDVATDVWTEVETDPPPTSPSSGTSFAYDGSRYLYWNRGGSSSFYRYDPTATAGGRWEQLDNTPGSLGYGSGLVYRDGAIYTMRGNAVNPNPLYKYDVGTTSWSSLTSVESRIYNDGFLVDGVGNNLYACRGENTKDCFVYSISGDSWTGMADAPDNIRYGGSAAGSGTDKFYMIAGSASYTFYDGLYSYVMETDDSSFEEAGNYVSQSHDLTAVYQFANLSLTYTSATNASLVISTRTSANESSWTDWMEVNKEKVVGTTYTYKINSATNRYMQVKFALASADGVYSGKVSDYTISYYQDLDNPVSHTSLDAYTNSGMGTTMTSGVWDKSTAPYFDWPTAEDTGGATDTATGSGVAGYYVYFGPAVAGDPVSVGTTISDTYYQASGLTSGQTYYLRIKAYDEADNVSGAVGTTHVYMFDNENPTNPQTVTVAPSGYSATNSYDFAWSGATDGASGVAQYCYKTGQVGSTDTCISDVGVSGIEAYDTGTNVFYVRAKDEAGNMPTEYSTSSYYYNSTSPSPPQNLAVSPVSNTINEFAFSWDPPQSYYGAQADLRYYYSINNMPTANNVNTVGLSTTYLAAGSYATQQGENYFYVVAKDEAGNIDYSLYSRVTFTADTSAPGIPVNIEIADVSVKATESWRLAISWDAPEATGSGVQDYKMYRSTTAGAVCSSDLTDFEEVSTTTATSYVDTTLEQVDYYYCASACDSTDNCSAVSDTVTYLPDGRWLVAPSLTASPSASVKTKSATISWSTSRSSSSFVKYGTESGSYGDEVGASAQISAHEVALEGLTPGTTYYYQALWTDEDGNTGTSDEISFVTNPAPSVAAVSISDIGLYSAYVIFTLANTSSARVEYGTTTNYGFFEAVTTSTAEGSYTVKVENLEEGTEYHLRIVAMDEESNVFNSDDYEFETLPVPKIVGAKIRQVKGAATATLRLSWLSNTGVSSIVTYYPEGSPEQVEDKILLSLTKRHQIMIDGLLDKTNYMISIKGKDIGGNSAAASVHKFMTSTDLRAPLVSGVQVEATVTGVGEEAKAQVVISWDTDEPATSQVEYGPGTGADYPSKTQEDKNLTLNHTVTIPDLEPDSVYHLRAVSNDGVGNRGESYDNVVVTPKKTKSALDLVIKSLSKSFGFFGNLGEAIR